jgi:hypothetical protein
MERCSTEGSLVRKYCAFSDPSFQTVLMKYYIPTERGTSAPHLFFCESIRRLRGHRDFDNCERARCPAQPRARHRLLGAGRKRIGRRVPAGSVWLGRVLLCYGHVPA